MLRLIPAAIEVLQSTAARLKETLEIPDGIIGTNNEVTGGRLSPEEARAGGSFEPVGSLAFPLKSISKSFA